MLHYNNSTLDITQQGERFVCGFKINGQGVANRWFLSDEILEVVAEFYHEKSPCVEQIVVFDKQIKNIDLKKGDRIYFIIDIDPVSHFLSP